MLEEHAKIEWGIGDFVGNHDPDAMATEDCYACVKMTTHCKVHDVVSVVPSLPASCRASSLPVLISAVLPASPPCSSVPTSGGQGEAVGNAGIN